MKLKKMLEFAPSIMFILLFFGLWEIVVRMTHIPSDLLPPPSLIETALVQNWAILLVHTQQTLTETLIGIVAAIFLGSITALLIDSSPAVRKTLYPFLIGSQTIPIIALAPLLLLWLGFDLLPKVIIVTLYCFFPIVIATADGLASIDPELVQLFKSMGASNTQTLWLLKIPSSLPSFFSGLKIAVTYSMTGAIVGEYIGAFQGLGIFIQAAAKAQAIPLVFAAIFIISVISLLLFLFVGFVEKKVIFWS